MPGRFLSSSINKIQGRKILMDCGEGTQVSMRVLKWGLNLDIICISHGHGDPYLVFQVISTWPIVEGIFNYNRASGDRKCGKGLW